MLKKILALVLVLMTAYIILPFGFGLWNERLNVSAQISFAEPLAETPEECAETENPDAVSPDLPETDEVSASAPIEGVLPAATQVPYPVEHVPSAVPLSPDPVELVPPTISQAPDPVEFVSPAEPQTTDPVELAPPNISQTADPISAPVA